ncbi:MAG TPA: hypothetical protein VGI50_12950 [Solirubrobacteraceae bacterium]|jgi:hypothetical protein
MSRITVLRPDFVEPPRAALTLAPRSEPPEPLVIGLISNGKPLAAELLQALADELRKRLRRDVTTEIIRKPSAGSPVTAVQADGMAARAHFVITGVGD